jgi:protein-tyrosine-phosphatase
MGPGAEVPDPYYGDMNDFEQVHALLTQATKTLLPKLIAMRKSEQTG